MSEKNNLHNNYILPIPFAHGPYGEGATDTHKYILGLADPDRFEASLNHLRDQTNILPPVTWHDFPDDRHDIGEYARSFIDLQNQTITKLGSFYQDNQTKLAVIGGDHSVSAALGPALSKHRDLSRTLLVWVDAHGDANDINSSISGGSITGYPVALHHGLGHPELLEAYNNHIQKVVYIGLRDIDEKEILNLEKIQAEVYSILDVLELGLTKILGNIQELAKNYDKIWLSIDIDALDPVFFEAQETDVDRPFGLSPNDLLQITSNLANNPKLDIFEITQLNNLGRKTRLCFMVQRLLEVYFGIAKFRFGKY